MVLIAIVVNTLILLHTLGMAGMRHMTLEGRICDSEQGTVKSKEGTTGQIKPVDSEGADLALRGDQRNKIALEG